MLVKIGFVILALIYALMTVFMIVFSGLLVYGASQEIILLFSDIF